MLPPLLKIYRYSLSDFYEKVRFRNSAKGNEVQLKYLVLNNQLGGLIWRQTANCEIAFTKSIVQSGLKNPH